MKENSYYGKFYHDPNSPVNPLRPFASSQSTQGLERIDSVLARVIEISETGLIGQSAAQSNIRLVEVKK
jgi:hypothetical protein